MASQFGGFKVSHVRQILYIFVRYLWKITQKPSHILENSTYELDLPQSRKLHENIPPASNQKFKQYTNTLTSNTIIGHCNQTHATRETGTFPKIQKKSEEK
jgi:hypothetical protein